MREKIKNFSKKYLVGFIIGIITGGSISVIAATYFPSNDVTYDNSVSGLQSTNVQGAIDELYTECTYEPTGGEQILDKENVVTSGDGLYEDVYEEGRYFYKGANPNNYITFNGETAGWRIMSIEADGTIKIMKNESIGSMVWDSSNSNNWARSATLNSYLQGTYLSSLSSEAQSKIVTNNFSIGGVTYNNNDLKGQINDENSKRWNGKIALPTVSEYLRTNSNTSYCSTFVLYNSNFNTCINSTWMFNGGYWWTLSANASLSDGMFFLYYRGEISYYGANTVLEVRPALYLSSEVQIIGGDGSQSNPYIIE